MPDKLVTIAKFEDSVEADLAKQLLADFGINSILAGSGALNPFAGVPAVGPIRLQVIECKAEEAREILESKTEQEQ